MGDDISSVLAVVMESPSSWSSYGVSRGGIAIMDEVVDDGLRVKAGEDDGEVGC